MYFCNITSVQRLVVDMSLHPHLAARAVENLKIFLSPHPLSALGMAILSHFTHVPV